MYKLLEAELAQHGIFNGEVPIAIAELSKAIPITTIPQRMKYTLAASELVTFASQFRRNIKHWNGSNIPINAITFTLSASGSGKDMAVQSLRKCFQSAYQRITITRQEAAKARAIKEAAKDGVENLVILKSLRNTTENPTQYSSHHLLKKVSSSILMTSQQIH